MLPEKPLVSILIPSYNHAEYVAETIYSIWKQPYPQIEIVVVDDCSTDNSVEILQSLQNRSPVPMRLYKNEQNSGPRATVSRALELSRGDLIIPFSSDDLLAPDRLDHQIQQFRDHPDLKILYGNGYVLRNEQRIKKIHGPEVKTLLCSEPRHILHYLYTHPSPFFLQCTLIRKDFLQAVGAYEGSFLADDWLLNVRMFENMKSKKEFAYLDDESAFYRQHESNLHKNFERHSSLKLEFIEAHTPDEYKPEAYANIHFDIARAALNKGLWKPALVHFKASQMSLFNTRRLGFISKFARKWVKHHLGQGNAK